MRAVRPSPYSALRVTTKSLFDELGRKSGYARFNGRARPSGAPSSSAESRSTFAAVTLLYNKVRYLYTGGATVTSLVRRMALNGHIAAERST